MQRCSYNLHDPSKRNEVYVYDRVLYQAREYKYVIQIVCLDMNLEIIVGEIKLANLS